MNVAQISQKPRHSIRVGRAPAVPGDFNLPEWLEAGEPPEARGLTRDRVRLLVSHYRSDRFIHARFRDIGQFLRAGDVLVINTSGTMGAAISARRSDGDRLVLHLSTRLAGELWTVEVRKHAATGTEPFYELSAGERLSLAGGGVASLLAPYAPAERGAVAGRARLWLAALSLPSSVNDYLSNNGSPIRYSYVKKAWPISYYQTVYATEVGSAEMPSAGRAFTAEIVTQLVSRGVRFAPLILHTGVSSLESHEPPYDEFFRVPAETAQIVNAARESGRLVIAVGTTSVRALETVTDEAGKTLPGEGWTSLVVARDDTIRSVNGLLTGFHEPRASHLAMLESLAGSPHLDAAYRQALDRKYLWHEFGDLHLLLP